MPEKINMSFDKNRVLSVREFIAAAKQALSVRIKESRGSARRLNNKRWDCQSGHAVAPSTIAAFS
jgi:hypothetical protein